MPNRNVDECSDNVSRLENELGFTSTHSSKYVLCYIPDRKTQSVLKLKLNIRNLNISFIDISICINDIREHITYTKYEEC